jgi:biopolymer transport protein TolQ
MQFTLVELWHHMGLFARAIVFALCAMSMTSLLIMFERWFVFARSRRNSINFAQHMAKILASGNLIAAAHHAPTKRRGYLGRVISSGLQANQRTINASFDKRFEAVARALERQAQREVQNLRRGLGLLASISSTAPFVGLLGTVVGIVNSFQQMAASGAGGLATVSAGISEALVTTAVGLFVAIPALVVFNYLQGWVEARAVDLAESSNELLDVVADGYHPEDSQLDDDTQKNIARESVAV